MATETADRLQSGDDNTELESAWLSPFLPSDSSKKYDVSGSVTSDRHSSENLALPWVDPTTSSEDLYDVATSVSTGELSNDLEGRELNDRDYEEESDYENQLVEGLAAVEDVGEEATEREEEEEGSPFAGEEWTESAECCGHDEESIASDFEEPLDREADGYSFDGEVVEEVTGELENEQEFDTEEETAWGEGWSDSESAAPSTIAAGTAIIESVPLLKQHRGIGPDLILAWNEISGSPTTVDVVVHLHGYSLSRGSRLHIARDLKPRSGLDWSDPRKTSAVPGRSRPTLALLPRGHFYGGQSERGYSFPALTSQDGVEQLVAFGLQRLATSLGLANLARGRLILTAHSGGGAALLRILRQVDPHEVHVFDGLYQDAEPLTQWATRRIQRDQSALAAMGSGSLPPYMAEQGGALRVLHGAGTAEHSREVARALAKVMPPDSPLQRWYRVERTTTGHLQIPPVYGWRLLSDASADLPNTSPSIEAKGKRSPQHELSEQLGAYEEVPVITRTGATVSFPSGETLPVIVGPGVAENDDHYDPVSSGNPLLDTGVTQKTKKLSTNLSVRELTSSGGVSADIARIDPRLVVCLQRLRDHVGKAITITSGFRSWKRNRDVYAARNRKPTRSQHCAGRAADIKISGMNGLEIAKAAIDSCGPNIGIGVGDTYAHIDVRGVAAAWNYGGATKDWVLEVKRYQTEKGGSSVPAKTPSRNGAKPISELVRFAQRVLNAAEGERLDPDGNLGQLTRGALGRFRTKYGLGAGDALDERTGLALAQRALEELAQQSIFQIGVLDATTKQAFADFKRNHGLGFDSTLDAATRAALGEALARRSVTSVPSAPRGVPSISPAQPTATAVSLGIDTASVAGNKNPNWADAKAQVPVNFAIIRSNYGVSDDRVFRRDWPRIRDAGMVRGAYLFLRFPHPKHGMKAPDPVSQANAMIRTVGALSESDLPPTIDVEFPGGRKVTGLTARQCLDRVRAAWKVVKDHYHVAPIIYTSARVWKEDLDSLPAKDLAESPLWLARYPFKKGPSVYDAAKIAALRNPPVPPPWGDATNWWIHQYQGDAVKLPGFPTGNVDMNRFNVMMKGATGDRVKWVQRRVGMPETGTYDDALEAKLRAFQQKKALVADGVIDPRTFAFLCWSNVSP